MYSMSEFDKAKTRILKYIIYKKRTEKEIREKFQNDISEEMLDDIIDYLKEAKYIDDYEYIEKTINEYNNLKSLSIVEVKYKLLAKGINKDIIEEYIDNNKYALEEYEVKSAKNIIQKKRKNMDDNDIKIYLIKKGYKQDNIREALESED